MNKVLVSENRVRLMEVYRLIRYLEGRNANYGRNPAYDAPLSYLRNRRDKLKSIEGKG